MLDHFDDLRTQAHAIFQVLTKDFNAVVEERHFKSNALVQYHLQIEEPNH
jgi:hypothetical protein